MDGAKMKMGFGSGIIEFDCGGISVCVVPFSDNPLAHMRLIVSANVRHPAELTRLDVLQACWSNLPVCIELEDAGGAISAVRKNEWLQLEMTATVDAVPLMLECCRAVLSGAIDDEAVAVAKRRVSARTFSLGNGPRDPALDADLNRWSACYGHVPAVMRVSERESIAETTAESVRSASLDLCRSGAVHLVVVGDIDPARIRADIEPVASGISKAAPIENSLTLPRHHEPRLISHYAKDFQRTSIRLAYPISEIGSQKEFLSRVVSSVILGGTPQSRLSQVFRDELGVSYDISALISRALGAEFLMINGEIANESAQISVDRLYMLLSKFSDFGPSAEEIRGAIAFLQNAYRLAWGTLLGRATFIATYITSNLQISDIGSVNEELSGLSVHGIKEFTQILRPEFFYGAISSGSDNLSVDWHPRQVS